MITKIAKTFIPTDWGRFEILAYAENKEEKNPTLVLMSEGLEITENTPVPVRIHSECVTGDIFHSQRCDCGPQLDYAMKYFNENGGILIYLRQEGRGIGLLNKIEAYNLQDQGLDTAEANEKLGFPKDMRTYEDAINILQDLGITQIALLSNNPAKSKAFEGSGIAVDRLIPIQIKANKHNAFYLETKKKVFGHQLE